MHILDVWTWALSLLSGSRQVGVQPEFGAGSHLLEASGSNSQLSTLPSLLSDSGLRLHELPGPWIEDFIQEYLSEIDRLQLFRTSTDLAACVLQHASKVQLTLNTDCSPRQLAAQNLIATGQSRNNLLLVLAGRAPADAEVDSPPPPQHGGLTAVWNSLLHLTLRGVSISTELLRQLQACTHLRTLRLDGPPSQQYATEAPGSSTCALPFLHKLELSSSTDQRLPIVQGLLGLTITHLSMESYGQAVPPFTAVTHLTVPLFTDGILKGLSQLPRLTHVSTQALQLFEDHSDSGIVIQHLEVLQGVYLHMLSHLPLASIQKLTLHAGLNCNLPALAATVEATQRLASCPGLVCAPALQTAKGRGSHVFWLSGSYTPELITVCAHGLVGGLGLCDLPSGVGTLSWLPTLPKTVTAVWFKHFPCLMGVEQVGAQAGPQVGAQAGQQAGIQAGAQTGAQEVAPGAGAGAGAGGAGVRSTAVQQAAMYWRAFIGLLPHHVTRLGVYNALGDDASRCNVAGLVAALTDAKRPIQLTLKTE